MRGRCSGAMLLLWLIAAAIRDVSFIDAIWGLGMAALALLSFVRMEAPGARAGLIAAMAIAWGSRLGLHLFIRWRRGGEDPRYAKILGKAKSEGRYAIAALLLVFGPQAVLLFITCLPAQLGIFASPAPGPLGPLALAGARALGVGHALRGGRRLAAAPLPRRPCEQGQGARHRTVALHPPPQLFRRRLRVVGDLARLGRGRALGRAGRG